MSEREAILFEVEGVSGSGKTTFIKTYTESDFFDSLLDLGYVVINDSFSFFLASPREARRFDPELKTQMGTRGMVIMVDSHAPDQFRETIGLIMTIQTHLAVVVSPVPLVIAANKQDQLDALSADAVRNVLNIPSEIPVVPCVATDKESVKRVLVALLDEVLKAMAADKE